ncbi:MAG TPA: hypothetical protein VFP68_18640 [Burkholderiaceae bacterium]|nr:hypothetical protein [Burkholderiaceae bacterium]
MAQARTAAAHARFIVNQDADTWESLLAHHPQGWDLDDPHARQGVMRYLDEFIAGRDLHPDVTHAITAAGNDSEEIILGLLDVFFAGTAEVDLNSPTELPAAAPNSSEAGAQVKDAIALRIAQTRAAVGEAVDILTFEAHDPTHAELMSHVGLNSTNIIDHLHDFVEGFPQRPLASMDARSRDRVSNDGRVRDDNRVKDAINRAGDDPKKVIENVLELVSENPPILSSRPTSSPQPAAPRPDAPANDHSR